MQPSRRLLFLCSGNYYRSRFAEIFFNWHAERRNLDWRAESRGLALCADNPGYMSRATMARLTQHGIALQNYLRPPLDVTAKDFEAADHVVAVKQTEHRPLVASRFPAWLERVEFWEVHDLDCAGPELAIPHLEREVSELLHRLASRPPAESSRGSS